VAAVAHLALASLRELETLTTSGYKWSALRRATASLLFVKDSVVEVEDECKFRIYCGILRITQST